MDAQEFSATSRTTSLFLLAFIALVFS
ncbi:MAG: hypothetical protein G01um101429_1107, partial [Parcubacteria group bacterium Gr01-1014_29]